MIDISLFPHKLTRERREGNSSKRNAAVLFNSFSMIVRWNADGDYAALCTIAACSRKCA